MIRYGVAARPSDTGPRPPRFGVGSSVISTTGVRGTVVAVHEDERQVKDYQGRLMWFAEDMLGPAYRRANSRRAWGATKVVRRG